MVRTINKPFFNQITDSYTSTVKQSSDNIRFSKFLNNMRKPVSAICLNFPSKKINPCENFVAFDFNQMKSTWKFLSVKTRIICRGVVRTPPSSYHRAFFAEKCLWLLAVGSSHRRCSKKVALKNLQNLQENICDSLFF